MGLRAYKRKDLSCPDKAVNQFFADKFNMMFVSSTYLADHSFHLVQRISIHNEEMDLCYGD